MAFSDIKLIAAFFIFLVGLLAGLLSIRLNLRFKKTLAIGDAAANGIFIGAALFHLLPTASHLFHRINITPAYIYATLLSIGSYFIFWLIEKIILPKQKVIRHSLSLITLMVLLSLHAFIAGLALGSTKSGPLISILWIAIIAHKAFEAFVFTIKTYQKIGKSRWLYVFVLLFALMTPLGILSGLLNAILAHTETHLSLTAYLTAVTAGTFLYIGTGSQHTNDLDHHALDSHQQYTLTIVTLAGTALMGILAIWI